MSNILKKVYIETSDIPYSFFCRTQQESSAEKVSDAKEKSAGIIEEAKAYAEKLKKEAELQAEAVYEEARSRGFDDGMNAGLSKAEEKSRTALKEISGIISELESRKEELAEAYKRDIVNLSVKLAEKILGDKISADEEAYIRLYSKAAKNLNAKKSVRLCVSNAEARIATSNSDLLLSMVSGAERIEIEVIEDAPSGTCIIETSEKIVDASVTTQLGVLKKAMAEVVR